MADPRVGTIGLTINMACGTNISAGTATMLIRKPNKKTLEKVVVVDNSATGAVHYVTVDGDLDIPGVYTFRSKYDKGSSAALFGDPVEVTVQPY
jgi:hypothetical protein